MSPLTAQLQPEWDLGNVGEEGFAGVASLLRESGEFVVSLNLCFV